MVWKHKKVVLKKCALDAGIDITQFNLDKTVSGRDIERRVQREVKRIQGTNVSVPVLPPVSVIRGEINQSIEKGEITIGKPIAPKTFKKIRISNETGKIEESEEQVYGRQIPLIEVCQVCLCSTLFKCFY